jgi:serine/threonine protein kinase
MTTNQPTYTNTWLNTITVCRTKVVIKIADTTDDLGVEWRAYEALTNIGRDGMPPVNFLRYHGYFKCNDDLARVVERSLDKKDDVGGDGVGDTMQVLVMDYVDCESMKNFDWGAVTVEVLQSCILQVVYAMLDAYVACKFVHGDLHLDNILIQKNRCIFSKTC